MIRVSASKSRTMRLAVTAMLCAFSLLAQPAKARKKVVATPTAATAKAPQSWPIAKLSVEGNKVYPTATILEIAGLKIGQMAGKDEFEAARERIEATGMFSTVGYKFEAAKDVKGYLGTFQVTEFSQLFAFRFEGVDADEKGFRAYLAQKEPLLADKIPGTQIVLARMAKYSEEYLGQSGKAQTLSARLITEPSGQLVAIIQPSNLPAVAEVHFTGSKVLTNYDLQQAIAGAAVGALFTENRFRQILEASIRPMYEAKGRLKVSFPKVTTAPAKDVKGLVVTVQVEEGPEYKLRKVGITGPLARNLDLLKEGGFHTDETVNYGQVTSGVETMRQILRKDGYLDVKAEGKRTVDEKAKAVDVAIAIEPGPQYKMGSLSIEGLDIETEPHVRKLWGLKPGAPFNADYPDYFLSRLKTDDLFDNLGKTASFSKPDPSTLLVDVTLKITADGKPRPRIGPEDKRRREQQSSGSPFPPI